VPAAAVSTTGGPADKAIALRGEVLTWDETLDPCACRGTAFRKTGNFTGTLAPRTMTTMRNPLLAAFATTFLLTSASFGQTPGLTALRQQVMDAERAFARTMADRDHAAFTSFLAEDAIFFSGDVPSRGRDAVAAAWKRLFDAPGAPFSWEPDQVEVTDSGTLAFSSGLVRAPDGQVVGRFNSIWRREASGEWRVVFDKGSPVCPPPQAGSQRP
jgi:ketosteroid isomerase-like protein